MQVKTIHNLSNNVWNSLSPTVCRGKRMFCTRTQGRIQSMKATDEQTRTGKKSVMSNTSNQQASKNTRKGRKITKLTNQQKQQAIKL